MEWQESAMNAGTLIEIAAYVLIAGRQAIGWALLLIVAAIYGAVQYSWWGFESMTVFVYPVNAMICCVAWYFWKQSESYDDQVGDLAT